MGDSSSLSRKSLFGTFSLALIALSNLTLSAAKPLQPYKKPVLAARDIWKPSVGLTWDYQLTGAIDLASTDVDVWDIDLVDATAEIIDAIHAKGKHVICYFSAGSFEDWRPDANKFQATDKGSALEGWEGENWLRTKSSNVRSIMTARMDLAVQKKCDGVEPDNVDAYDNSNGLGLTANDAVEFVTFLAEAAHSRNLAIGLKNAGSIVSKLVSKVEYSVQEECVQYGNCDEFKPFIDANKPVFHVEYSSGGISKRDASKKGDDEEDDNSQDSSEDDHSEDDPSVEDSSADDFEEDDSSTDDSSTDDSNTDESDMDDSNTDESNTEDTKKDNSTGKYPINKGAYKKETASATGKASGSKKSESNEETSDEKDSSDEITSSANASRKPNAVAISSDDSNEGTSNQESFNQETSTEDDSSEVIVSPTNASRKPKAASSTNNDSSAGDTSSDEAEAASATTGETSDSTSTESALDASSQDTSTSDMAESTASGSSNSASDSSSSSGSGCVAKVPGFSSIMKKLDLGAWVQICA